MRCSSIAVLPWDNVGDLPGKINVDYDVFIPKLTHFIQKIRFSEGGGLKTTSMSLEKCQCAFSLFHMESN